MRHALQPPGPFDVTTPAVSDGPLVLEAARAIVGRCRVPGDKSISHRYAIFAAMAEGRTTIRGLSTGADVEATLTCLAALGARIARDDDGIVRVTGCGLTGFAQPAAMLDAGNSGTTLRLLSGVVAGWPLAVGLTGDASLCRRPMRRIIDPLTAMGAAITSADGRPPLTIRGGTLRAISWRPPVPSAQVKSAILLAGLRAVGRTSVDEPLATRDHTERAFPLFGLRAETDGLVVSVDGGQRAVAPTGDLDVPGDPSSAAVWAAAAAALPGSSVTIDGVGLNPRRLGFLRVLERMGAEVHAEVTGLTGGEPCGTLRVRGGDQRPVVIAPEEVPDVIDELPVLAAAAALGGGLEVSGAGELRVKESDRISALVTGLRALGVEADERPDGFAITGHRRPTGGRVDAAGDHRLVMAFAIVGLGASGRTTITGANVVAVSYPGFAPALAALRA
ncbi:MAG TPA: 3-phosphoshikimate 1-carboxyvinyltransferase [Vicinamibacterales bacterium]|nr:3-phosphoshikimate 1-carboxyvinyltransferase [Vicinamibacterales bacterium]